MCCGSGRTGSICGMDTSITRRRRRFGRDCEGEGLRNGKHQCLKFAWISNVKLWRPDTLRSCGAQTARPLGWQVVGDFCDGAEGKRVHLEWPLRGEKRKSWLKRPALHLRMKRSGRRAAATGKMYRDTIDLCRGHTDYRRGIPRPRRASLSDTAISAGRRRDGAPGGA